MPSLAGDRLFGIAAAVAVKAPVAAATTDAIALSGFFAVDGVTLAIGDRVLVKHQSDASQNGIYTADSSDWRRTADFNGPRDVVTGTRVYVVGGVVHGGTEFVLTTAGSIDIGVTDLAFQAIAALPDVENRVTATRATATAGQTVFALGYEIGAVLVTVNGVIVDEADYSAGDGAAIAFDQGLNANDAVVAYSLNGAVNAPTAAFNARLSATATNVTGDGALYTVLFDTVDFDDGVDDFNALTGAFTAPKPGRYQLNAAVTLTGVTAAADTIEVQLVTTARTYCAEADRTDGLHERTTLSLALLADMDQGDTAHVAVAVAGEAAAVVDVVGGAAGRSHFSGFLLR